MNEEIIKRYKIFAKKSLGQNFLVNQVVTTEISRLVDIRDKNIIEVWPWYGALTEKLLDQKPCSLHLVELDRDMIEILEDRKMREEFNLWDSDFQIHNADVLDFVPEFQTYNVIANIPYYITSPILRHFLYNLEMSPESMVILMQKDVGDKILGKWKNKSSVLSLMVEKKCRVSEKIFVGKENFIPAPKIESSVLLFEKHENYKDVDDGKFLEVIKKWFLAPRKKLIKNLISWGFDRQKIEDFLCLQWLSENMRWEDGDIEFWIDFYEFLIVDS